ncbi:MAG: DNA-protecting protein DprA [Candidatus Andersenbacteria bacterium]|nr:DNA-protecting protein DprA [Candidatus Andersenbacteria bacterium]
MDDIEIIQFTDKAFPKLLKEINDPPKQLYARGNISLLNKHNLLAVVGSRKASTYGKQCIDLLLPQVIRQGIIIVSGLAYGIDSLAHKAAVAEKKPTIAVLGTGIDNKSIYPQAHFKLAQEILQYNGLIISEYPAASAVYKGNFPARNRIIAGISEATLLVQAAEKSGSLITGRLALEYNRDVAAVPGNITDPLSAGTNDLISHGAIPISKPEDILLLYKITSSNKETTTSTGSLNDDQLQLFNTLEGSPQHIEERA